VQFKKVKIFIFRYFQPLIQSEMLNIFSLKEIISKRNNIFRQLLFYIFLKISATKNVKKLNLLFKKFENMKISILASFFFLFFVISVSAQEVNLYGKTVFYSPKYIFSEKDYVSYSQNVSYGFGALLGAQRLFNKHSLSVEVGYKINKKSYNEDFDYLLDWEPSRMETDFRYRVIPANILFLLNYKNKLTPYLSAGMEFSKLMEHSHICIYNNGEIAEDFPSTFWIQKYKLFGTISCGARMLLFSNVNLNFEIGASKSFNTEDFKNVDNDDLFSVFLACGISYNLLKFNLRNSN